MRRKIWFELQQDEDGYPPVGTETVWAIHRGENQYEIDNIPFFEKEATLGDVVETVEDSDGLLSYKAMVKRSGNSLIRVVYYDTTDPGQLLKGLKDLGCLTELDKPHHLIAVNVSPEVELESIQAFLRRGLEQGLWGYEEPILMQRVPDDHPSNAPS